MFNRKKEVDTLPRKRSDSSVQRSKNYSYYESRTKGEDNLRKTARKKQNTNNSGINRPWYIQLLNIVIIVLLFVFLGYDSVLNGPPKVIITGDNNTAKLFSVSLSKYQAAATKVFNESITSRDKVTINTSKIAKELSSEFPELANVSLSIPLLGHQPTVTLIPAQPAVIATLPSQLGSFLVSSTGRVIAESILPWPKNNLPKIIDQTGIPYAVGQTTLSPTDISFIELVSSQFSGKGLVISSMTLPSQTRELDVYLPGVSYFVKFNLEDNLDAQQQIGTFFATKTYIQNNQIVPSTYIDARVVGRVFYK